MLESALHGEETYTRKYSTQVRTSVDKHIRTYIYAVDKINVP